MLLSAFREVKRVGVGARVRAPSRSWVDPMCNVAATPARDYARPRDLWVI
jgi:hypothetical protein